MDLIFDLLRDNHLPSLKTLDLSDNPKSIGKGQISKLADSFFSGNNNLETLDLSCVYPPPTDLRGPFKPRGERLVGDAYAGDYPLNILVHFLHLLLYIQFQQSSKLDYLEEMF